MTGTSRMRRLAQVAIPVLLLGALAACAEQYPNSTFNHTTEFNTAIDALWNRLLLWGTIVFVVVEAILIYTIIRYRPGLTDRNIYRPVLAVSVVVVVPRSISTSST